MNPYLLLGLLPVSVFLMGVLLVGNAKPQWGWDRSFLRCVVFFGAYAVLSAEFLSLFHALTWPGVVAVWFVPALLEGAMMFRMGRGDRLRIPRVPRLSGPETLTAILIGLSLMLTARIAFLAPPNTWDSLTYHLPRAAHWAQAGSLEHFATGIERQNLMSPGAELSVMQAYVLARGDSLVNFPQWLAMVASLVAVGALAHLLRASRLGQLMAALFLATLPMGIAQASSTMTDYIVTIWVLCAAFETLSLVTRDTEVTSAIVPLSLAAGLAVLTKPTAFAFLAPLALVVAIVILRRGGVVRLLTFTAISLALVLTLNGGYLGRNLATFGNPLGGKGKFDVHANQIFNWKVVVSNVSRNELACRDTLAEVNAFAFRGLVWLHPLGLA
jgi:hypothetical protein